ncbi:hypothetical protein D1007_15205 [Hordeum vulgare]|nr:hypothetical protein D1007_15205 [Hordeum vulgare]
MPTTRSSLPLATLVRCASSPFLTFSIVPRSATGMSATRDAWDGSNVDEEHIEFLRHRRKLPSLDLVATRIPAAKNSPAPQTGEVVVFAEHLARGFPLPASNFFFRFLTHFA